MEEKDKRFLPNGRICNVMILLVLGMLATGSVGESEHPETSQERKIRQQLQMVSTGLRHLHDRGVQNSPQIMDRLRSMTPLSHKALAKLTGDVIFCDLEAGSRDYDTPLIIFVDHDADSFFRVVYSWNQDVRIVKRGTGEYRRIRERVREHRREMSPDPDGEEKLEIRPMTFRFLDENSRPITGRFTLQEYSNGTTLGAWYSDAPVKAEGVMRLEDTPKDFRYFFTSEDTFYIESRMDEEVDFSKSINEFKIQPTGTIVFSLESFPQAYHGPMVLDCYWRKADNTYARAKGMGIFPVVGHNFEFKGLRPGVYKIELKRSYEDKNAIFSTSGILVEAKRKTAITPLRITEDDLKAKKTSGKEE